MPDAPMGASDHSSVKFCMEAPSKPSTTVHVIPPSMSYNWRMADYESTETLLLEIDWYAIVCANPSAPALWDAFNSIIHTAIELNVPHFNVRTNVRRRRYPKELRKHQASKRLLWSKLKAKKCDTLARAKYMECAHLYQQLARLHELRIEEHVVETNNNVGSFSRQQDKVPNG